MTVYICFPDQSQRFQAMLDVIEMNSFLFGISKYCNMLFSLYWIDILTARVHLFPQFIYLFGHWLLTKAHYSHGAIFRLYFWPCCLYYERTVQRKTGNNWTGERGMGSRNDHEPELKLGSPEALLRHVSESYYFYWNVPMLNSILKALQWGKAGNSALVAHSETCE